MRLDEITNGIHVAREESKDWPKAERLWKWGGVSKGDRGKQIHCVGGKPGEYGALHTKRMEYFKEEGLTVLSIGGRTKMGWRIAHEM